jgi:hypothetical protein
MNFKKENGKEQAWNEAVYASREKYTPWYLLIVGDKDLFKSSCEDSALCREMEEHTVVRSVLMCTYRTQSPVIHMRWNA